MRGKIGTGEFQEVNPDCSILTLSGTKASAAERSTECFEMAGALMRKSHQGPEGKSLAKAAS